MIRGLPHKLAKYILTRIRQEEIMERYLSIPVQFKELVCSTLRVDNAPTAAFYWSKGKLKFHDWNGAFHGDCFDVVKQKFNCSFPEAVNRIANDFGLISLDLTKPEIPLEERIKPDSPPKIIQINRQAWTYTDKMYWRAYHLTSQIMEEYFVYSCKDVFVNGNWIYTYSDKDPAYAYYFGNGEYKIYFPLRSGDEKNRPRFITNSKKTTIQGIHALPKKANDLIITKSYKDIMCLKLFNIPAVAPQAETVYLNNDFINDLYIISENIYSLYDFDYAGIRGANSLKTLYGIPYLFFTNGKYNTVDYGAKDFSDYLKLNGIDKTQKLIDSLL